MDLLATLKQLNDGTIVTVTNGLDGRTQKRITRMFRKADEKVNDIANLFAGYEVVDVIKTAARAKVIIKKEARHDKDNK